MKKTLILLGICSVILACNSSNKTSSTEDTTITTQDTVTTLPADTTTTITQAPPADVATPAPPVTTKTPTTPKPTEQKPASTEKGQQLISKSDCLACHKVNEKLVGPAYTAVAIKYDDTDANLTYLANKIISGGAGVWGEIPMTPHPAISTADAKEMARYILSLK